MTGPLLLREKRLRGKLFFKFSGIVYFYSIAIKGGFQGLKIGARGESLEEKQ
jgi:hypothetical protein